MSVNHPSLINAVTAAKRQLGPEQGEGLECWGGWLGGSCEDSGVGSEVNVGEERKQGMDGILEMGGI